MTEQSDNAIRGAVQECLPRCYGGNTPLGVLAEFMAELREKDWGEQDIRTVESAVRKVLAGVMVDSERHLPD